jgi:hypothetical protein
VPRQQQHAERGAEQRRAAESQGCQGVATEPAVLC